MTFCNSGGHVTTLINLCEDEVVTCGGEEGETRKKQKSKVTKKKKRLQDEMAVEQTTQALSCTTSGVSPGGQLVAQLDDLCY